MEIFPKIAKTFLYFLLGAVIILFTMDIGKTFVAYSENGYVARNASSYVNTFSVDEEAILGADYGEQYVELDDIKDNLSYYLKTHFGNTGYKMIADNSSDLSEGQFKMVFIPENGDIYYNTVWGSTIFARAQFYGFDGTPPLPNGVDGKKGLIRVNIEQKIPAGIRNFMIANGLPFRSVENPANGEDYEGFVGYYSVESEHSFTINIVK